MARSRSNFFEEGDERGGGSKETRGWQRDRKDKRFQEIKDPLDNAEKKKAPPRSNVLHIGNRLPEEAKPKDIGQGSKVESKKQTKEKKYMYRTGPTPETATRQPLPEENSEEKLARLEEKIANDFRDSEKEYVDLISRKYLEELQTAKKKLEEKGEKVNDQWVQSFRQSYINDRTRWGSDKKRWGSNGPLAPEKAEIFEKYLKLKLPVGFPEEKIEYVEKNTAEKKEVNFSPEQSSKLIALIREVRKIQDQIEPDALQEIIEEIIREDLIAPGIFSEDDFSRAYEHVNKWLKKFNHTK